VLSPDFMQHRLAPTLPASPMTEAPAPPSNYFYTSNFIIHRHWIPQQTEAAALAGYAGRAFTEFEARVEVFVDMRGDWYAAEQQILAIRDALWPALLRHGRLGGTVSSVIESDARPGRGLCYEEVAGNSYRCFEALWWVRQQFTISGGRAV
jgi:hypothetical protein